MSPAMIAFLTVFLALFLVTAWFVVQMVRVRGQLKAVEKGIMENYFHKIDKIPAIVETIRKYAQDDEIYREMVSLHRKAIISNARHIYDILENDVRISSEFRFFMKLSSRIPTLLRDGNFLYARDFWLFYEVSVKKEYARYDILANQYEDIRRKKNATLIGLLFPFSPLLPTQVR